MRCGRENVFYSGIFIVKLKIFKEEKKYFLWFSTHANDDMFMCIASKTSRKIETAECTCVPIRTQTVVRGSCLSFVIGFLHVVYVGERFIRNRSLYHVIGYTLYIDAAGSTVGYLKRRECVYDDTIGDNASRIAI